MQVAGSAGQLQSIDPKIEQARSGALAGLPRWVAPLAIFLFAFAIRLAFNLFFSQHRIADIGDGYLYLITGNKLLGLFEHSRSIADVLAHLGVYSGQPLDGMLTSTKLVDRLLLDGPVYPLYLAMVQWVTGIPPGATNFSLYLQSLTTVYSLIDALTCLVVFSIGRRVFDDRTAVLAGLIYAVYPPAVLNTANSFSEPFAAFCLTTFVFFLLTVGTEHNESIRASSWLWLAAGVFAGLTMLVRSAFVIFPLALVVSFLASKGAQQRSAGILPADKGAPASCRLTEERRHLAGLFVALSMPAGCRRSFVGAWKKNSVAGVLVALCATTLVLAPYLLFTWWQTGKPSFVSRAPGYNISIGNCLPSDGWICYSPQVMLPNAQEAMRYVGGEMMRHPVSYASLYLRKIDRLWAGAWNDFQHDFILSPQWQDVLHQVIILSALFGIWLLLRKPSERSHTFAGGLTLSTLCLLHCLYIFFIPMSRYAFTAMPSVVILAAFGITQLASVPQRGKAIAWASAVVAYCILARFLPSFVPLLMVPSSSLHLAQAINAAMWLACWLTICLLSYRIAPAENRLALGCFAVPVLLGGGALCLERALADPTLTEWHATLSAGQSIRRTVVVPKPSTETVALLVDCVSNSVCPSLHASINGHALSGPWIPWLQLKTGPRYDRFVDVLSIQSHASGLPMYQARQWWVLFVPPSVLAAHGRNSVTLTSAAGGDTVYGDYVQDHSTVRLLPSLSDYSYLKGFTTFQRGDCRLFNLSGPASNHASSYFNGKDWIVNDLSADLGCQMGDYRVFLTRVPQVDGTDEPSGPMRVISKPELIRVSGNNPLSFAVEQAVPVSLPRSGTGQCVVSSLACDVRGNRAHGSCSLGLLWSAANRSAQRKTFVSPWQPESIATSNSWSHVVLNDVVFADVSLSQNVVLQTTAAPFHAALLFNQRSEALKRRLEIRNLSIDCFTMPLVAKDGPVTLY
jgi:hypothetical protein